MSQQNTSSSFYAINMFFRVKTMGIKRQKELSIDLKNIFDVNCFSVYACWPWDNFWFLAGSSVKGHRSRGINESNLQRLVKMLLDYNSL